MVKIQTVEHEIIKVQRITLNENAENSNTGANIKAITKKPIDIEEKRIALFLLNGIQRVYNR